MEENSLFDSVYELGEVISRGPHSELRRCRRIGKKLNLLFIELYIINHFN